MFVYISVFNAMQCSCVTTFTFIVLTYNIQWFRGAVPVQCMLVGVWDCIILSSTVVFLFRYQPIIGEIVVLNEVVSQKEDYSTQTWLELYNLSMRKPPICIINQNRVEPPTGII